MAEVIPGYSEKRPQDRSRGELRILQARDVAADGTVRWNQLDPCEAKPGSQRALLLPHDVVLTVRSAAPRALLIDSPPIGSVAGSTFAILRCRTNLIDPRYLLWFLQADGTRERLQAMLRGSAMPFVGIEDLQQFTIPLPSLATQRVIARVHELRCRITTLTSRHDAALGRLLEAATLTSSP